MEIRGREKDLDAFDSAIYQKCESRCLCDANVDCIRCIIKAAKIPVSTITRKWEMEEEYKPDASKED